MANDHSPQALTTLNFVTLFPHKYWVSDWSKDEAYPDGYRYKLLSARPEPEGFIELLLLIEQPGGYKQEMKRMDVSPSAFDRTAQIFIKGLTEAHGINFELLDLSAITTFEEFDRAVTKAGWREFDP